MDDVDPDNPFEMVKNLTMNAQMGKLFKSEQISAVGKDDLMHMNSAKPLEKGKVGALSQIPDLALLAMGQEVP